MTGRLHFGYTLGAVLVAAMVIASGWIDMHRYFAQQMPDSAVFAEHSAGPTFAGDALASLAPNTRVIMDPRLTGQPTIEFLAPHAPRPDAYSPIVLPLTTATTTALFVNGDQSPDIDLVRSLYPGAAITTFTAPRGDPVLLQEAVISAADVAAIQGLNATLQPADGAAAVQTRVVALDGQQPLPVTAPFDATFEGALDAPAFGDYVLQVDGPTTAQLRIDDQPVADGSDLAHLSLPRGVHHLEVSASIVDASESVRLLWQPPGASELSPVPAANLFASPATLTGLLGRYYPNDAWSGDVAFQQIDPFLAMYFQLTPLRLPFSVEWSGQLAVPVDGTYSFDSTSNDSSQIFVDEREVRSDMQPTLSAGWHPIRVRYEAHSGFSHIELRWKPPGQDWQIVSSTFLLPRASVSSAQPLPNLPAPRAPATQPNAAAASSATPLTPEWAFAPGTDSQPTGVALDTAGNVYVVDGKLNTLVKLDSAGHLLWTATPPSGSNGHQQLSAVGVAPDEGALVLDGETGVITHFDPDGQHSTNLEVDAPTYHPRGLAVGPTGDIYLADTGDGRELHLSADGKQLGRIGGPDNASIGLAQPSGVGLTSQGDVVVADPASRQIFRFSASGATLDRWDFGGGPTVNGPQVAVDAHDTIWVADTSAGRLEAFSVDGSPMGSYAPADGLVGPSGVAVGDGYVVVAEPGASRVRKFALP
ncbi:MAG: hypothetical protein JO057_26780 [Chloroflexi bacterium]|nr:hypothetical protein [Chloroflexota bacterium]